MYPEFIAIYIGLGVLFVMMAVALVLLIMILKGNSYNTKRPQMTTMSNPVSTEEVSKPVGKVVFCKNCATEYSASEHCCPKCGTPR